MDTLTLGKIGEASVVTYFVKNGYEVYSPLFGNTSVDLLVYKDDIISRVEVKSTSRTVKSGAYEVSLRSVRSNKTKNVIKKFDSSKSDILAVYIEPENRVILLKSCDYDGRCTVNIKRNTIPVLESC